MRAFGMLVVGARCRVPQNLDVDGGENPAAPLREAGLCVNSIVRSGSLRHIDRLEATPTGQRLYPRSH